MWRINLGIKCVVGKCFMWRNIRRFTMFQVGDLSDFFPSSSAAKSKSRCWMFSSRSLLHVHSKRIGIRFATWNLSTIWKEHMCGGFGLGLLLMGLLLANPRMCAGAFLLQGFPVKGHGEIWRSDFVEYNGNEIHRSPFLLNIMSSSSSAPPFAFANQINK